MTVTTNLSASDDLLVRLTEAQADLPVFVSCYLRLDVGARTRRRYLVDLLNRIRRLKETLTPRGLDDAAIEEILRDCEKIVRYVALPDHLPSVPGLALFACERLGLFEVQPVPRIHRSRIDVDTRPLVRELIDARESLGHYLAVMVDRAHVRFFHVAATGTEELTSLTSPHQRGGRFHSDRHGAPGVGEYRYHRRRDAERHELYARIAHEIGRQIKSRPYRGVALLGPRVHTEALIRFLPERLERLVIGASKGNPTSATPAEVSRAVWQLQREHERKDEAALIARIEEGRRDGLSTVGVRATLQALARSQVRTLLVPDGFAMAGFRCTATGRLSASSTDCRGEGEAVPLPNLIDHAIEDALRDGAEVVVIDDPNLAPRVDGLAAALRFRTR